jgi:hypothetical protein
MVTFGGMTEFEHEVPKINKITSRIVALTAGDALRGARLAYDVAIRMPADSPPVQAVVEAFSARYVESRSNQINSEIFQPRGIRMQDFYGGQQQRMLAPIAGTIDEQVISFNYQVEVLVAGADDEGAHIWHITNPGGSPNDFRQIGFHAIGSGMIHALQSLIGFGHTGTHGLHETLFRVYASKRRAEVAPGVGTDTDLAIILQDGITWVKPQIIDRLKECYLKIQRPEMADIRKEVSQLELFEKEGS